MDDDPLKNYRRDHYRTLIADAWKELDPLRRSDLVFAFLHRWIADSNRYYIKDNTLVQRKDPFTEIGLAPLLMEIGRLYAAESDIKRCSADEFIEAVEKHLGNDISLL